MSESRVDVYQVVTDRMLELLEAGTVPWRKPWNAANGPRNLNGNLYRGVNVFLLGMAGYDSPFWMTFKQAKERGGSVRKGEKSTFIVFWKRLMIKDKDTGDMKVIPMLKYYRVFNLEQTDDVKLPKRVAEYVAETTDEHVANDAAEAIMAGYPNRPRLSENGSEAFYVPELDAITLPPRNSFPAIAEFYSTAFHEMTHSTGHTSRLDRWSSKDESRAFGSHAYGREELIAEMGAAFLSAEAGLSLETEENSAAYLASWIATIKADPKAIVTAAGAAQRAADHILGRTWEDKPAEEEVKTEELVPA